MTDAELADYAKRRQDEVAAATAARLRRYEELRSAQAAEVEAEAIARAAESEEQDAIDAQVAEANALARQRRLDIFLSMGLSDDDAAFMAGPEGNNGNDGNNGKKGSK